MALYENQVVGDYRRDTYKTRFLGLKPDLPLNGSHSRMSPVSQKRPESSPGELILEALNRQEALVPGIGEDRLLIEKEVIQASM